MRIRITKKDINSIQEAIDFINSNTDSVFPKSEVVYWDDIVRRLSKIYKKLNV